MSAPAHPSRTAPAGPSRTQRARAALGLDDPRLLGLLLLLSATTALYVAMHLGHRFLGVPWHPAFDLGTERGYGEVFFQTLTGWSIVLFVIAAVRRRARVLVVCAAFAAYLLADDYFMIHERIGTWFALNVLYVGRLSTDLGEALWMLMIGILVIVSIAVAYRFSRREVRRLTVTIGAIYAALVFFGVVVDAIHSPFIDMPIIDPILIALEDGGEIGVMSVLVVFLLSLALPATDGPHGAGRALRITDRRPMPIARRTLATRAEQP